MKICNTIPVQHYTLIPILQTYCWGNSTTVSLTQSLKMAALSLILPNKMLVAYLGQINLSGVYMEVPDG